MKRYGFRAFLGFLTLNFLFSLFLSAGYLVYARAHISGLPFLFSAYVSNTFMLLTAAALPALGLYFLRAGAAALAPFFALFQLALAMDLVIYKIFRIHINPMVINIFTTPGGLATLGLSPYNYFLFALIVAALLAVEILFYRLSVKPPVRLRALAEAVYRKRGLALAALLLAVALDKGLCAWGTLYDKVHITSNLRLLPLYQQLHIRSFARKYLGVAPERKVSVRLSPGDSGLRYPLHAIVPSAPERPLNILLIVIDSLRADMLTPDIMPYSSAFARKASVFRNHYSGGNCTRFGIFSLIYGLYGNYWFPLLGERRGPVLVDELLRQGYETRLFASAELTFPEFDRTCFAAVPRASYYDRPEAEGQVGKDSEITDRFLEFLERRDGSRPYFSFIFYDASHGGYMHPPEFAKFLPESGQVDYLEIDMETTKPLFNKYRNSILFEDSLVGRILDGLKKSGGLEDTAVVITGDHGEAFFERGFHGHNRGFSPEEIRVPLVLYVPGRGPGETEKLTSHDDVAPTLMRLLGVSNPPADYSSGRDLFGGPGRDSVASFSWDTAAVVKNGMTVVLPLQAYGGAVALYGEDYRKVPGREALEPFMPELAGFQKEASRFYK